MKKNDAQCVDLSWVNEFILNVKPYIFVRLEDNLLIKRPNQAQKLNSEGAKILKSLLDGKSVHQLLNEVGYDAAKMNDLTNFISSIKCHLEGTSDEFTQNPAVDVIPFEMRFSRYPILSEIALTYRCNLKCGFCYAGCYCTINPIHSNKEMKPEEIKMILWKLFHQAKVPSVSFTGGEPTLISELPSLIRYAKDLGMRVNLITNGTHITKTLACELADNGLDSAQVSLEGTTSKTHDTLVGKRGAYSKSIRAVKILKEIGVVTHTNSTITRANLHECPLFPLFVKNVLNSDRFSMNLMIPTGNGSLNSDLIVTYSEAGSHLEKIIEESERVDVEFMWYSPVPMCMFNSIPHGLGNKGCGACDGLISIAPNGDVLPCASYDDSVGNLLRQDFQTVWHSVKAKMYRDKMLAYPECRACENFSLCHGGCPLYWRQMGFDELKKQMNF